MRQRAPQGEGRPAALGEVPPGDPPAFDRAIGPLAGQERRPRSPGRAARLRGRTGRRPGRHAWGGGGAGPAAPQWRDQAPGLRRRLPGGPRRPGLAHGACARPAREPAVPRAGAGPRTARRGRRGPARGGSAPLRLGSPCPGLGLRRGLGGATRLPCRRRRPSSLRQPACSRACAKAAPPPSGAPPGRRPAGRREDQGAALPALGGPGPDRQGFFAHMRAGACVREEGRTPRPRRPPGPGEARRGLGKVRLG